MSKQRIALTIVVLLWIALFATAAATYRQWGYRSGYCVIPGDEWPLVEAPVLRKRLSFLPGDEFVPAGALPDRNRHPAATARILNVFPSPFRGGAVSVGELRIEY